MIPFWPLKGHTSFHKRHTARPKNTHQLDLSTQTGWSLPLDYCRGKYFSPGNKLFNPNRRVASDVLNDSVVVEKMLKGQTVGLDPAKNNNYGDECGENTKNGSFTVRHIIKIWKDGSEPSSSRKRKIKYQFGEIKS